MDIVRMRRSVQAAGYQLERLGARLESLAMRSLDVRHHCARCGVLLKVRHMSDNNGAPRVGVYPCADCLEHFLENNRRHAGQSEEDEVTA
jgi:hypothetical protein